MNYKVIAFVLISYVILGAFTYSKGYSAGEAHIQLKWDQSVAAATNEKLDTKGVQDEVQSSAIDINVTARRLLNGTF